MLSLAIPVFFDGTVTFRAKIQGPTLLWNAKDLCNFSGTKKINILMSDYDWYVTTDNAKYHFYCSDILDEILEIVYYRNFQVTDLIRGLLGGNRERWKYNRPCI